LRWALGPSLRDDLLGLRALRLGLGLRDDLLGLGLRLGLRDDLLGLRVLRLGLGLRALSDEGLYEDLVQVERRLDDVVVVGAAELFGGEAARRGHGALELIGGSLRLADTANLPRPGANTWSVVVAMLILMVAVMVAASMARVVAWAKVQGHEHGEGRGGERHGGSVCKKRWSIRNRRLHRRLPRKRKSG
jgi:hypothetical protein